MSPSIIGKLVVELGPRSKSSSAVCDYVAGGDSQQEGLAGYRLGNAYEQIGDAETAILVRNKPFENSILMDSTLPWQLNYFYVLLLIIIYYYACCYNSTKSKSHFWCDFIVIRKSHP